MIVRHGFVLFSMAILTVACSDKDGQQQPPMAVSYVAAKAQDTPIFREYVGQVQALNDIAVRPRISGTVISRSFTEGGFVRKGQPLYVIDPREYRTQVAAASAQLAAAKAEAARAGQDVARYRPLVQADAIARQVYDTSVAASRAANAQVSAAAANLDQTNVALSYTVVRAPVSGQIGEAFMDVGSLASPSGPEMARVSDLDPISIYFNPSEQDVLEYQHQTAAERQQSGRDLSLVLADGSEYPLAGHVDFANRSLNPETGSLEVRAVFPNPGAALRPGMFGRVRLKFSERKKAIIIPDRAVVEQLGSNFVFVVDKDNKVEQRQVEVGPHVGGQFVVNSGVKAGDRLLVDGLQRVQSGMTVDPKPFRKDGAVSGAASGAEKSGQSEGQSKSPAGKQADAKQEESAE